METAPSAEHLVGYGRQSSHDKHCFIVMPFGREPAEQKWFKGWYEVVIRPAVIEAGYEPKLAAAEEQPGAINDEIRTHLAFDPMVVVDLGGAEPEDDPNPNVMYELGVRHALGLPLVIMAWKGQRLPFDVSNQRVITEDRELVDLETNRKRLVTFIRAAEQGKYYRPMEAVGRLATIQAASETLGEDSLLRALAQEVRDLKTSMLHVATGTPWRKRTERLPTIKNMINGKVFRKELYPFFTTLGGDSATWARLLRQSLSSEQIAEMQNWQASDWKTYLADQWQAIGKGNTSETPRSGIDPDVLAAVKDILPPQPWEKGVHREVASKLDLSEKQVSRYIRELIRQGIFMEQVDGELFPHGAES